MGILLKKYNNYKYPWSSAHRECSRYPTAPVHYKTLSKYATLTSIIFRRSGCKSQLLSNYDQVNKMTCSSSILTSNTGAYSYVGIKPASPNEIMSLLNITELRFFNEFSTFSCTTSFSNIIAV